MPTLPSRGVAATAATLARLTRVPRTAMSASAGTTAFSKRAPRAARVLHLTKGAAGISVASPQTDHVEALGRRRHQPVGTQESARDLDGVAGLGEYIGAIGFPLLPDLSVVEIEDGALVRRLSYSHDVRGDMRQVLHADSRCGRFARDDRSVRQTECALRIQSILRDRRRGSRGPGSRGCTGGCDRGRHPV